MSTGTSDPTGAGQGQPTEEELRAAYEAELKKVRVEHVLLEHVVTMVNLGMRRTGLAPGTEPERDPGQVRLAIESIRALSPLLEQVAPEQVGPVREALSQLQLAFVRIGGATTQAGAEGAATPAGSAAAATPSGSAGAAPPPGPEGAPGAREGETPVGGEPEPAPPQGQERPQPQPGEPGPAQRSGRLWVPGQ
jgi:hypothetical protein